MNDIQEKHKYCIELYENWYELQEYIEDVYEYIHDRTYNIYPYEYMEEYNQFCDNFLRFCEIALDDIKDLTKPDKYQCIYWEAAKQIMNHVHRLPYNYDTIVDIVDPDWRLKPSQYWKMHWCYDCINQDTPQNCKRYGGVIFSNDIHTDKYGNLVCDAFISDRYIKYTYDDSMFYNGMCAICGRKLPENKDDIDTMLVEGMRLGVHKECPKRYGYHGEQQAQLRVMHEIKRQKEIVRDKLREAHKKEMANTKARKYSDDIIAMFINTLQRQYPDIQFRCEYKQEDDLYKIWHTYEQIDEDKDFKSNLNRLVANMLLSNGINNVYFDLDLDAISNNNTGDNNG